jgi:hypothetical protein
MQRIVFAKLMLMCALLPSLGGCELLRLNEGRGFAVTSAGYAGRFRIAHGRWPDVNELEEFSCMRGRADRFGLALLFCEEVVNAPYETRLTVLGPNLRMTFLNAEHQPVCELTVLAPPARADRDVFPMIVIRTSVFACRGGRSAWGVNIG